MKRRSFYGKENILNGYAVFRIFYVSVLLATLGFLVNGYLEGLGSTEQAMQTTLITTIVFGQVFYMINCRDIHRFSITKSILKNKVLWLSLIVLLFLQLLLVFAPFMHIVLGTSVIGGRYVLLALLAGIAVFIIVEIEKFMTRQFIH